MNTPTVSPTDTYGIFSFSGDSLTTTVSTTDLASVGTYTITTSLGGSCISNSVSYDVIIQSPCLTATFTIDSDGSTFPAGVEAIALTYKILIDTDLELTWNTATDIVSSITGTDPCGTIVQEIVATNASGSTEYNYNNAVFSEVGTALDPAFRVSTTELLAVGLAYLRLKVYYSDYQVETETNKDFIIDLQSICDDPVSVTAPAPVTLVDYLYTGTTSPVTYTIAANPFVVDPVECLPVFTYTCSNTGTRTDICNMNEDGGFTIGSFDAVTESFTLQTTNMIGVPPDTYVVSILGTVGLKSTTGQFTFNLVDPCPTLATITITTEIFPASVTHIFRDPQIAYSWDFASNMSVTGVSADGNCGSLEIDFFYDDGSGVILGNGALFNDDRGPPSQFKINYTDDPAHAGILPISYRVYLIDYPSLETFPPSPMITNIIDPCKSPTATVTSPTLTDQLQYVGDPS